MGRRTRVTAVLIAATATLAGCTSEPTGPSAPSFLSAAITGSLQAQYEGSGTFRVLPSGIPGARFSLHSQGLGAVADQGFAFHAMNAPTPGEYPIGEMGRDGQIAPDKFHANYWYDRDNIRTIFKAQSGTVRISESTPRRVAGSFHLTATLLYNCILSPNVVGQRIECEPTQGEETAEITGSFDASPLGGDRPGLTPSP